MSVVTQWPAQRLSQSISWGGIQVGECERHGRHGQTDRLSRLSIVLKCSERCGAVRDLLLYLAPLVTVGRGKFAACWTLTCYEIDYTNCKSGLARTLPTAGAKPEKGRWFRQIWMWFTAATGWCLWVQMQTCAERLPHTIPGTGHWCAGSCWTRNSRGIARGDPWWVWDTTGGEFRCGFQVHDMAIIQSYNVIHDANVKRKHDVRNSGRWDVAKANVLQLLPIESLQALWDEIAKLLLKKWLRLITYNRNKICLYALQCTHMRRALLVRVGADRRYWLNKEEAKNQWCQMRIRRPPWVVRCFDLFHTFDKSQEQFPHNANLQQQFASLAASFQAWRPIRGDGFAAAMLLLRSSQRASSQ